MDSGGELIGLVRSHDETMKEIKQLGALRSALKFSLLTLAGSALVGTRAKQ